MKSPNNKLFFLVLLAVFIGGLAAMLAWTLIVKNQVTSAIASTGQSPLGKLLGLGGTP
jgi:hypothetical protein